MRKTFAALAIAFSFAAHAVDMLPSHVSALTLALNPAIAIDPLFYAATTTTAPSYDKGRVVVVTADSGSAAAPTLLTDGISLDGAAAVQVVLQTSANATAAKGVLAYRYDPAVGLWARCPDWDLTAIAATIQTWSAVVPNMKRGRVTWVPSGVGSVATTITMVAQPVVAGTAAP
jgi:hypothetical protein